MNKTIIAILSATLLTAGCVTAKKVVRDRVDQDLNVGNRGFVEGAAPAPQDRKKTREYIQVDVQTPFTGIGGPYQPKTDEVAEAERRAQVEPMAPVHTPAVEPAPEWQPPVEEPAVFAPAGEPKTYKVQKGDTLSEISQKVYGKAKYWKNIFDANQPALSDPNKLRAGMTLILPEIETAEAPRASEK